MSDANEFLFDKPVIDKEMFDDAFALAHGADNVDELIEHVSSDSRIQDLSFRQGLGMGRFVRNLNKIMHEGVEVQQ